MDVNQFFPDKVCINLDRRPDRWKLAEEQFALHSIEGVRRFPALDGRHLAAPEGWTASAGAYGCLRSHLAVVMEARRHRLPKILILEDDAVFDPEFTRKFARYVEQLPADWDMLLFGGLHVFVRPRQISENVVRLAHSYSTFAYALQERVYDSFIELNSRSLEPVDKSNVILQQTFNCYGFMPHLAWVEENYSDTQDKLLHPWYVKESIVIASPELDQIQRQTVVVIAHRDRTEDRSATRNLRFLLDYYARWYPLITLLVVEQDAQPGLRPRDLPEGALYHFLPDGGPFNRALCFQTGFRLFEQSREVFIFSDADVHLDRENIMANLELCLRHDFVSAYARQIDLSEADTRQLIRGEELDLKPYERQARSNLCLGLCFFTRRGLQRVGGWEVGSEAHAFQLQSGKVREMLSAFSSPNTALRLHHAGRERVAEEASR